MTSMMIKQSARTMHMICLVLLLIVLNLQIITNGVDTAYSADNDTDGKKDQQHGQCQLTERNYLDKGSGNGLHHLSGNELIKSPFRKKRDQSAKDTKYQSFHDKGKTDKAIGRTDHSHDGDLILSAVGSQFDRIGHDPFA